MLPSKRTKQAIFGQNPW